MSLKSFIQKALMTFIVSVNFIDTGLAQDLSTVSIERPQGEASSEYSKPTKIIAKSQIPNAYQEWHWLENDCYDCEILIVANQPSLQTKKVAQFIQALSEYKNELQQIYKIDGAEYTLLAHMSVGILGRESLFFTSTRYRIKEAMPWAVHLAKIIQIYLNGSNKSPSLNSRGPTQIKVVPGLVAERFSITPENLHIPENAAIATMAYLIEALTELKNRAVIHHLDFIKPSTYVDYLPYIYFGKTKSLLNHTATPWSNIYVQDMKRYMSYFDIYERWDGLNLNSP